MANSKQAKKRAGQAEKRRLSNKWQITRMRTSLKKVRETAETGKLEDAKKLYNEASSYLDKLACKGIISLNKASRHKAQLSAAIKIKDA